MPKSKCYGCDVMCLAVALLLGAGAAARGDVLMNVDFNGASSPTYVGPAVLGAAGDKWNGIGEANDALGTSPHTVTDLPLITSDGSASRVKLNYTLSVPAGAAGLGGFDVGSSSPFSGQPGEALMRDYLFAHQGTGSFTISGLTAGGAYELVVYSAANSGPGGAAVGRDTAFTVGAVTKDVVQGNNSTFVQGGNFTTFDTTADAGGTISFSMASGNGASGEPDINGFQLRQETVAVPEPVSVWGGAALLVGLGVTRVGVRTRCATRV